MEIDRGTGVDFQKGPRKGVVIPRWKGEQLHLRIGLIIYNWCDFSQIHHITIICHIYTYLTIICHIYIISQIYLQHFQMGLKNTTLAVVKKPAL